MNITIELDTNQARDVCRKHVLKTLCISKQYLSRKQIEAYKFIIREFSNLVELQLAQEEFDKCWPDDVKWEEE